MVPLETVSVPDTFAGEPAEAVPVVVRTTESSRPSTIGCTVSEERAIRRVPTPVGASVMPVRRTVFVPAGPVTVAVTVAAPSGSAVIGSVAVPAFASVRVTCFRPASMRTVPWTGMTPPVSSFTVTVIAALSRTLSL